MRNRPLVAAKEILGQARSVTVLTGAGISTDSGIPDYRGPQGVWTKDPRAITKGSLQSYVQDESLRQDAWLARLNSPVWTARANPGHLALARLVNTSYDNTILTQNVDGLHQASGVPAGQVVELHGTIHRVRCLSCFSRSSMTEVLTRVTKDKLDPRCLVLQRRKSCGGILTSDTVAFGEPLHPEVLENAKIAATHCEVFLVVGSSLSVTPAASLVPIATASGAKVIIINESTTHRDNYADILLRGSISDILLHLIEG